jgi:hypothetical protein
VAGDVTNWYQSSEDLLVVGDVTIGIRVKEASSGVALPDLLVAGDVTNWYQSQGFNTEPGWAMLVEVEEKVSEKNCCRNGQNSSSEPRFKH